MARIIKKKKKKKITIEKIAIISIVITVPLWIFSSLFLNSINVRLTMECQKMENHSKELIIENEKLRLRIASLQSKDRVISIAEEAGMTQQMDNVYTIKSYD